MWKSWCPTFPGNKSDLPSCFVHCDIVLGNASVFYLDSNSVGLDDPDPGSPKKTKYRIGNKILRGWGEPSLRA
jgi:hypothetical protein